MHSSESFHYTVLERIRSKLDSTALDAKYSNQYIIQHEIMPSMVDVWARLNMTMEHPIIIRHAIDLVEGQELYILPPNIQTIWRLAILDEHGCVTSDFWPGGIFNPSGPGWYVEGNELVVRPYPISADEIDLWYTPNGDVRTHYATDGMLDVDGLTFTLSPSPALGLLDRRENAYAGSYLRIIPNTGPIEERIIRSHDASAGTVVVRRPFSTDLTPVNTSGAGEDVIYEIAPPSHQALYEAIAIRAALKLGVGLRITQGHDRALQREYIEAIKSVGDNYTNLNLRLGHKYDKLTVDNQDWWMPRLGLNY